MKKLLVILISVFFILNGIEAIAFSTNKTDINNYENNKLYSSVLNSDELDQFQTQYDNMGLGVGFEPYYDLNLSAAQTFIPQKSILTRVELFISCIGYFMTDPYTLAIRKDIDGENLAVSFVDYSQIPFSNPDWVEFNFDDITVIPGETYYLVSYTTAVYLNEYFWGGSDSNPYSNGVSYVSFDGQQTWETHWSLDACFKTYGKGPDLEISKVSGGFGKIKFKITNNYGSDLTNVHWNITVRGGILGKIKVFTDETIGVLTNSATIQVSTDKIFFGLGSIQITVNAEADQVGKVIVDSEGLVILFFVFIF